MRTWTVGSLFASAALFDRKESLGRIEFKGALQGIDQQKVGGIFQPRTNGPTLLPVTTAAGDIPIPTLPARSKPLRVHPENQARLREAKRTDPLVDPTP